MRPHSLSARGAVQAHGLLHERRVQAVDLITLLVLKPLQKLHAFGAAAEPRVAVGDFIHDAPMKHQHGVGAEELAVQRLGPLVKRVVAILQGDDKTRVEEHSRGRHG